MIRKFLEKDIILIYQMGKVGSDSLVKTIGPKAIHLHTLYGRNPNDKNLNIIRNPVKKIKKIMLYFIIRCLLKFKKNIKIITVFRDLKYREPSMFFQDLDAYIRTYRGISFEHYVELNGGGINKLKKIYNELYDFEYASYWMNNELSRFAGIDFLSHDKKRYYSNKGINILVLNMDEINTSEQIISDFVGEDIQIKQSNGSEEKWYSTIYRDFCMICDDKKYDEVINEWIKSKPE
jgi:hypothetical protein